MARLKVSMSLETSNPEKLASILSHHADYVIDFDDNKDILTSVENVQSYEIGQKNDRNKINMIADILQDILPDGKAPSYEDLDSDDDAYELYTALENLSNALEDNGYM